MSNNQQPIHYNSISELVYMTIKKEILEIQLPPGTRLPVLEIAKRFQVSQAPVREALERLKQEGLIIGKQNKGSVVSNITSKEVKDIFVLREMIEGFAVRESMPHLKESDFDHLKDIIQLMDQAIQRNDVFKMVEHDMEFHGFFYERCNNHAVLELWDNMKTKVMRFMAISNKHRSTDKLVEGHLALIDVLKTGDTEKAEKTFIDHMKSYKLIHLE
ncbi:GntR family transcriptional regulator [Metabacillus sp. Hm71]|uniref:GntR family transcriptional regulator n=1 Tax=Metabacillus sp. Hm71 TaxID=3450743 RepID=UPI003F41CBB0